MMKIIEQGTQSLALYQASKQDSGEVPLKSLISTAQERIKLLKIADSSPHGWGTVSEYEANPITQGDEDDKKLKKAEKAAQEKSALRAQERSAKQARFSNYNRGGFQGNNFRAPGYSCSINLRLRGIQVEQLLQASHGGAWQAPSKEESEQRLVLQLRRTGPLGKHLPREENRDRRSETMQVYFSFLFVNPFSTTIHIRFLNAQKSL